jgi:hypothetical protein
MIAGETDVLKALQATPGVKGGVEGSSGMYVRGGGADQNYILIDGVPVYNVSHLLGFLSVFNVEAIQGVTIYKGNFPARYAGRLSSVVDVKMKEGNANRLSGSISAGLVSFAITLEGPIVSGASSFIISARRTYLEPFLYTYKVLSNSNAGGGYYFYDLNGKFNHRFTDRTRLYLSLYNGLDKLHFKDKSDPDTLANYFGTASGWGNTVGALRLNHIVNDRLFCNFTLTASSYTFFSDFSSRQRGLESHLNYISSILDVGGRVDFDYVPSPSNHIRTGFSVNQHRFNPGEQNVLTPSLDTTLSNPVSLSQSFYGYAENEQKLGDQLQINYGLGVSYFIAGTANYTHLQPRISGRYYLTESVAVLGSIARMVQHLHFVTSSNIQYPTDVWILANASIKPSMAWIYTAGTSIVPQLGYEVILEAYYKPMQNLLEYKEGASFVSFQKDWSEKFDHGAGEAKGIELCLKKSRGKLTGWAGYTLAYSNLLFPNINNGNIYPHKYDRRHDVNIVTNYNHSERFSAGLLWVYSTGNALTLADERIVGLWGSNYQLLSTINYFSGRNAYRMPAVHRLDVSFNFHKKLRVGNRTLSVGLYNAYNKLNPTFLKIEDGNENEESKITQYSFFPVFPFINYTYKF